MKYCKECNSLLIKREKERTNDFKRRMFCNTSCSAKFNNRLRGKNKPSSYWCSCGARKHPKAERCNKCKKIYTLEIQEERTIGEISIKGNSRVKWSHLRSLARKKLQINNIEKKCKYCGFDVVVDVCHIRSINKFDLNTKVKVVNSLNNLIYLCPNHHAMLDRGLINIEDIEGYEKGPVAYGR